jgi:putative glycosyltransferase (TIGR04372 family)
MVAAHVRPNEITSVNIFRRKRQPRIIDPITAGDDLVRYQWILGVKEYHAGNLSGAVEQWRTAAETQGRLAANLQLPDEPRYFAPIWSGGFGHISHLEFFVKARAMGLIKHRNYIVLAHERVANRAYLNYFQYDLDIVYDPEAAAKLDPRLRSQYLGAWELEGRWYWMMEALHIIQRRWHAEGRPPLFRLNPDHASAGERFLEHCGIPRDAWFVTVHIREGGVVSGDAGATDSVRNASIEQYLPAIEAIARQGGYIVRTGEKGYTPLGQLPNVVDYATALPQKDWMDVYLLAAASFVVATNSGPAWVPGTFGTPALLTNWGPSGTYPTGVNMSVLPKQYYRLSSGVNLTPAEGQLEPVSQIESLTRLKECDVGVRENSAEEITAAVEDFIARHGFRRRH